MEVSRISSLNWIKPNAELLVKQLLLVAVISVHFICFSTSADSAEKTNSFPEFEASPSPTSPADDPLPLPEPPKGLEAESNNDSFADFGKLPPIEARTYKLKVVRRSNSNKIYLFEDIEKQDPKVGRILLFKQDDEKVMAFRVLKTYPNEGKVAAKRVKRYRRHRYLDDGSQFLTLEKVSDVDFPPNTPQDNADLAELEKKEKIVEPVPTPIPSPSPSPSPEPKADAFDDELDKGMSPSEKSKEVTPPPEPEELDTDDSNLGLSVEEPQIIDHSIHWLTAGFGYVRNNGPPATGGFYNFTAGNIRYGISIGRMVFLRQPHLQDSITLEGGVYIYKAISFADKNDAYTIASFLGAVRYNILFSESFGIFIYAGVMQSRVLSSVAAQDSVISSLSSSLPAGGGGLLFQVGPSWYIRADIGLDAMGLNLLLRL